MTINNCAVFDTRVGVRMENKIRDLTIRNLAFGDGVERKYHMVGRGPFPGYDNQGESRADPFEAILKAGGGEAKERSFNAQPQAPAHMDHDVEAGACGWALNTLSGSNILPLGFHTDRRRSVRVFHLQQLQSHSSQKH